MRIFIEFYLRISIPLFLQKHLDEVIIADIKAL